MSPFQDDELFFDESSISSSHSTAATHHQYHQHHQHPHLTELHRCSQPKMPPYPIGGYMVASQARQDCRETASLMRPRRTSEYPILTGDWAISIYSMTIYNPHWGQLGQHTLRQQSTKYKVGLGSIVIREDFGSDIYAHILAKNSGWMCAFRFG